MKHCDIPGCYRIAEFADDGSNQCFEHFYWGRNPLGQWRADLPEHQGHPTPDRTIQPILDRYSLP